MRRQRHLPSLSPSTQRYGGAVVFVGVALLARLLLDPVIGESAPLLAFTLATATSALLGGFGPGILSTALSTLVISYFFSMPYGTLHVDWPAATRLALFTAEGALISIIGGVVYQTRRREEHHTRALQQSEERFRLMVEGVQDYAIYMLDPTGVIISWNSGAVRVHGYAADEIVGEHFARFYPLEEAGGIKASRTLHIATAAGRHEEEGWRMRRDGSRFWAHVVITSLRDEQEQLRGFAKVTRDMTERRSSEALLRSSEARLQGILRSAMDAIITVGADQRIMLFNAAAEQLFGYTSKQVMGQPLDLLLPERYRSAHRSYIPSSGTTGITSRSMTSPGVLMALRAGGEEFPIEASISQIDVNGEKLYTVILRDISARRRLEAQLLRSQKLETVGRLAGGIAHDFNNLLTVITGNTELALAEIPRAHAAWDDLHEVQRAAERASLLTRQLLAFARKQVMTPELLDINALVRDLDKMLRRLIGADIDLILHLTPSLQPIHADPGQIEQVLVNLAVNARDAMPSGGKLLIETSAAAIDADTIGRHADVKPGAYVTLTVSDTGIGMSREVQANIFEPFFTTKDPERGTGLGLSTCYGIVRQHGGYITCYSEEGKGTRFTIYLPPSADASVARPQPRTLEQAPRGNETVLLAEDEAAVRALAARVLRNLGYTVIEAVNGADALVLARNQNGATIDLLLTDLVMPDLGGRDLIVQLTQERPAIKVILMSGYSDSTLPSHHISDAPVAFIQKPFSPITLATKVRQILDSDR